MSEVERLLHHALVPIEPPGTLAGRLERRLTEITDAAAEELADWELGAMRDPRRWARLVAAGVIGGAAGGALIVVRARQQQRREARGLRGVDRAVRQAAGDVRRRLAR